VSTVLRPVGPRGPRVYWIRRAILLAIVLVVVIVLAAECSGGGGKPSGSHQSGQNQPGTTPSSTKPAVPLCSTSALSLTLSTDTKSYTSGQSARLIAAFANNGSVRCKLVRSAASEVWTIKSGPATVWTTEGCPESKVPKQMKLTPGVEKTISILWNGRLRNSTCQEGAVASAGHYAFDANLDGVPGQEALFTISASAQ
jgi:hypothetical protein